MLVYIKFNGNFFIVILNGAKCVRSMHLEINFVKHSPTSGNPSLYAKQQECFSFSGGSGTNKLQSFNLKHQSMNLFFPDQDCRN